MGLGGGGNKIWTLKLEEKVNFTTTIPASEIMCSVPTMSLLSTYIVTIVPTQVHAISSTACGPTCTITINKHAQLHISESIILVEISSKAHSIMECVKRGRARWRSVRWYWFYKACSRTSELGSTSGSYNNLALSLVLELNFEIIPYSGSVFTTRNKHWWFLPWNQVPAQH